MIEYTPAERVKEKADGGGGEDANSKNTAVEFGRSGTERAHAEGIS